MNFGIIGFGNIARKFVKSISICELTFFISESTKANTKPSK